MIDDPKTDDCKFCKRILPRQWIAPVLAAGKPLAGTGVWQSQVDERGRCFDCLAAWEAEQRKEKEASRLRAKLIELLGGEKPYREFVFERFKLGPGSRTAYALCKNFNPVAENLYLWGAHGVGKTHLAYASARRCFEMKLAVSIVTSYQMSLLARTDDPETEQATIKEWIAAKVLILDDFGASFDTTNERRVVEEILDGREFKDRAGLIITSAHSVEEIRQTMDSDGIASRLAGICRVVELKGDDGRLSRAPFQTTTL
jgi:DNA replication protein DnaC